jgi:hypothetical protein
MWQCPAHADSSPSLSIGVGTGAAAGSALVRCFAGCETKAVLEKLGLRMRDLYLPVPSLTPAQFVRAKTLRWRLRFPPMQSTGHSVAAYRLDAIHQFGDRWRLLRWRHRTTGAKELRWESRDASGAWIPGLRGGVRTADLPLYRAADLPLAIGAGEPIVVVESESSVDALNEAGYYAVTWAGGAENPPLGRLVRDLTGAALVRLVADHDEAGIACALRIGGALTFAGIPMLSYLPATAGHDVRDALRHRQPLVRLSTLVRAAHRDAELMTRHQVCDVCGSSDALRFAQPWWLIRCRIHNPRQWELAA